MKDSEYIACPLCGMDDTKHLFMRKDLGYKIPEIEFPVVRCRRCNLVYVNPRPNATDIHQFYPENFYSASDSPEQTILEKSKSLQGKYDKVKNINPGALLDIGCSKGEFMYMMKNKGWNVKGLDFSSKPPNLFNLDIYYGDLDNAPFEKESFDLITLWAVLEHVYDPKRMLASIDRILKPGGKLVLLVTNFNSIPARFMRHDDVPRHTTLFTKRTISAMLRQTGYETEKFFFGQDIFGGSVRGALNYCVKLLAGEKIEEIIAQNRTPDRWHEFSSQIRGKESKFMLKVDAFDIAITPILDRIFDQMQLSFIMTVVSRKSESHDNFDASQVIPLKKPFHKEQGVAWQAVLYEYASTADNIEHPHRSELILLEDGKPLWFRHIPHDEIRKIGKGRYSHWEEGLIFSTTDNSDPNTNGRTYQIVFAESAG